MNAQRNTFLKHLNLSPAAFSVGNRNGSFDRRGHFMAGKQLEAVAGAPYFRVGGKTKLKLPRTWRTLGGKQWKTDAGRNTGIMWWRETTRRWETADQRGACWREKLEYAKDAAQGINRIFYCI